MIACSGFLRGVGYKVRIDGFSDRQALVALEVVFCVLDAGGVVVCDSVIPGEFERGLADRVEPGGAVEFGGLVCVRAVVDPGV